ncbi:MAG TPA: hypothetical protein VM221_06925 [Armatimonadota bacterium]|nr:hypothetical protein [Armatimonadota bacterium]
MTTKAKVAYVGAGVAVVAGLAVGVPRLLHHGATTARAIAPDVLLPLPAKERARVDDACGAAVVAQVLPRLCEVYASLPAEVRQTVITKGEYEFHVADLPKAQGDVINDLVLRQHIFRGTLEDNWLGKGPLDLSNPQITFLFQRQGPYVALRCRYRTPQGTNEANWAPIGVWPGGAPGR